MSVRDNLAAAANTVEGVSVHPYFVQGTSPGHGYVRLDRIEYPRNGFGAVLHWGVFVVLPQTQAEAEGFIEDHAPALYEALSGVMAVTEARPERLSITGLGDLPCLFITGHREE